MHYQLFLPGKSGANLCHLHEVGLGWLQQPDDSDPVLTDLRDGGPDGGPGQLASWLEGPIGFRPDQQTWRQAEADPARGLPAGRYWIGWESDSLPTSAEIARKQLIDGITIELGGQDWIVPSALRVPRRMTLRDGVFEPVALDRYRAFVERSAWAFDACQKAEAGTSTIPMAEAAEYAVESLQWNYRLPRELADVLGLLNVSDLWLILASTTDLKRLMAIGDELKNGEAPQTPSG